MKTEGGSVSLLNTSSTLTGMLVRSLTRSIFLGPTGPSEAAKLNLLGSEFRIVRFIVLFEIPSELAVWREGDRPAMNRFGAFRFGQDQPFVDWNS
jgi:hypothetical protein